MPRGNIFLNYRRDDTAGHAGRLFDRLNQRFPGRVFRDVTGIAYGLDFVEEIERKLASCQVLIVLIGRYWLTLTDEGGRRRLDDENDFVRLEIVAGLRRNVRVIPVLVNGARMPRAAELPEDLRPLTKRQALEITEPDFDNDAARLIHALEEALGEQPRPAEPEPRTEPDRKRSRLGLYVGLGAAALVALLVVVVLALNRTPETRAGGPTQLTPSPTPGNKIPMTPSPPPDVAVEKKRPQPSPSVAATPTPAPTQGVKSTPTPTPRVETTSSPAARAPAEEYFDAVGQWRVTGPELNGTLVCRADGSFHSEGTYRREFGTEDGTWWYGPNRRVVMFSVPGDDVYKMRIKGKDADGFHAYHSFYRDIVLSSMTRR